MIKIIIPLLFLILPEITLATTELPSGASSSWLQQAIQQITKREYRLSRLSDGRVQAPNRRQDLRILFSTKGITVLDRSAARETPLLTLSYAGLMRDSHLLQEAQTPFTLQYHHNRAELSHGNGITEWFINNENGLEHGFLLEQKPGGDEPLSVLLEVANARFRIEGDHAVFTSANGRNLRYTKLKVHDACGRLLPASLQRSGSRLALHFDDHDAIYPVEIDPLLTAAADVQLEANQSNALMGYSVASAGDINGDDIDDVIIGAAEYDNGKSNEGAVFVYHGDPAGISTTPDVRLESDHLNALLGSSVAAAGDINNDGFGDIVAGAPGYSNGENEEGAAFIYFGSINGLFSSAVTIVESNTALAAAGHSVAGGGDINADGYADIVVGAPGFSNDESEEGAAWVYFGDSQGVSANRMERLEENQDNAHFGISVALAPDVDGDGFSDVLVGAEDYNGGEENEGAVFLYRGSANGLASSIRLEANQGNAHFGSSVASSGDVNKDGFSDIIVGARSYGSGQANEGAVFIYHGGPLGVSDSPAIRLETNQAFAYFGSAVANGGDLNGDGYDDVVVGAPQYDHNFINEGAVFTFYGGPSGVSATPSSQLDSGQASALFGLAVGGGGDFNDDGYDDLIAGALLYDNGENDEGAAFIYYGNASGMPTAFPLKGIQSGARSGFSVASAGDINGDGHADLLVGAPLYDDGQTDEGAVFLYYGSDSGVSDTADMILEGNQENAFMGFSLSGAGDVNGDGYADIVVSFTGQNSHSNQAAQVYLGSDSGLSGSALTLAITGNAVMMGNTVTAAGDVNGDGYDDIAIGAQLYANGQANEGGVFIFHGGFNGTSGTPDGILEINQTEAFFGASLAAAGDVNADGYDDLIVGAPGYSGTYSDAGRAFIFHGSSSGLSSSPAIHMEGDKASAGLGATVAGIGDVNGDGFSDVAAGSPIYNDGLAEQGMVSIYHGSFSGIAPTVMQKLSVSQAMAGFGSSISGGDINGDGYSDLLVGIPELTSGGAVFAYLGGDAGIPASPSIKWKSDEANARLGASCAYAGDVNGDGYGDIIIGATNTGQDETGSAFFIAGAPANTIGQVKTTLLGNQADARLGYSVAGAGDVNGDGYADVLIGAPEYDHGETNEGAVFVYQGAATGLNGFPTITLESDQANAQLGSSVASAGDINGDGYYDVILGAPLYDNGENDEGAAFVYTGSATGLASAAHIRLESNQSNAQFGASVASAGDVNGDGYADILVGAPNYSHGESDEGVVFVHYGSSSGLSDHADLILETDQNASHLGVSVASAGDVDGDGYADVVIGADQFDNGKTDQGAAFIYHGAAGGLAATAHTHLDGIRANSGFGHSVAAAGDVNADGFNDIIVGAPDYGSNQQGAALVYYGSATGISASNANMLEGRQNQAHQGISVASAGDVNGDGYADVVVGAYAEDDSGADEGFAFIHHGSSGGIAGVPAAELHESNPGSLLGWSVSNAGDINGDGYSDVIVGAYGYGPVFQTDGAAYIYYGNGQPGRQRLPQQRNAADEPVADQGRVDIASGFQLRLQATASSGRSLVRTEAEVCPSGIAFGAMGCRYQSSSDWTLVSPQSQPILTETFSGLNEGVYRWRLRQLFMHDTQGKPGIAPPPNPTHGPWRYHPAGVDAGDIRVMQQRFASFTSTHLNLNENAGTINVNVRLSTSDHQPTRQQVEIEYSSLDDTATAGSDYQPVSGKLVFPANSNSGAILQLSLVILDDEYHEDNETLKLCLSPTAGAVNGSPSQLDISVMDNDQAGIHVGQLSSDTSEDGAIARLQVALQSRPTAAVTIPLSSSDPGEGTVSPGLLTFDGDNWNQAQDVTIKGVDDDLSDGNQTYQLIIGAASSLDPDYNGMDAADLELINRDNEKPGFSISPISGPTNEDGGSANFTLRLSSQPTAEVTLNLSSSDTSEGRVSPTTVHFDSSNWNQPQMATVTGIDDDQLDGDQSYTIIIPAASSSDPDYQGVDPADITVVNVENDQDSDCSSPPADVSLNQGYSNGFHLCVAEHSISHSANTAILIEQNAHLRLCAPSVKLMPGFAATSGAILQINTQGFCLP